jgi:cell division septation protein DedD
VQASTKERLTGALILVLALVVIAPELLTGRRAPDQGIPPAQDPEEGAPLQTYSVALDAPRSGRVATVDAPAASAAEPAVPPPVVEEEPPRASADDQARAAASARPADLRSENAAAGKWWVQAGSFESRANAQALAEKLREAGFATAVSEVRANGKDLYRVRAGPVVDRESARALQARLIAAGQKNPTLVPP